jgi:ABC-type phosphate transport system substrate-binding protein
VALLAWTGTAAGPAGATTPSGRLLGEGGSFAEPIVNQLLIDDNAGIAPLDAQYFNANVDIGRQDVTTGDADFAVSEFPLTADEVTTGKSNGRSFAYVPFAASPVTVAPIIECSAGKLCPDNLQLTVAQLAGIFTQGNGFAGGDISFWDSTSLNTIAAGGPLTTVATDSRNIKALNLIDPSASTEALMAAFEADPAAKANWDTFLTFWHVVSTAPAETWPTQQGVSGGDQVMANDLVPLDTSRQPPVPLPFLDWGLGDVAPLPVSWLGAPRNIPTVAIENAAGKFVPPTVAAASAALADATVDPATNLVTFKATSADAASYNSYLMQVSYLVVPTSGLAPAKATALASFIRFALSTKGQADVVGLGAAPILPATGSTAAETALVKSGLAIADQVAAEATTTTTTTSTSTTTTTTPTTTTSTTAAPVVASNGSDPSTTPSLAYTGGAPWPIGITGFGLVVSAGWIRRRLRRRAVTT